MAAYIYCRVSSKSCQSLETQERILKQYANRNGFSVTRIYREQCSAYKKIPHKLSTLRVVTNNKIIFMAVDRFMRNVSLGQQLADDLLRNNNELHFIREGIILNELHMYQWPLFIEHLTLAQRESDVKSSRMKFWRNPDQN